MHSNGKHMTGRTIIYKEESFNDEMKMNDKCAFTQDLLQTFKEAATQGDNQMEYFCD